MDILLIHRTKHVQSSWHTSTVTRLFILITPKQTHILCNCGTTRLPGCFLSLLQVQECWGICLQT